MKPQYVPKDEKSYKTPQVVYRDYPYLVVDCAPVQQERIVFECAQHPSKFTDSALRETLAQWLRESGDYEGVELVGYNENDLLFEAHSVKIAS